MDTSNLCIRLLNGLKQAGDKPCLAMPDGTVLSAAAMVAETERLASALHQLGLKPGDRVLVIAGKSPAFVTLYLACLYAGLVFVPVNPGCTESELAYLIGDAQPSLLMVERTRKDALEKLAREAGVTQCLALPETVHAAIEAIPASPGESRFPAVECRPEDTAVIIYTSGTTGKPKGAMLSHGNLVSNLLDLAKAWAWQPDDVLIHALPVFHVHGLFVALHLPLLHASTIHFLPHFDADAILALLPEATVLMGVPTFYTRLLGHRELTKERCDRMRLFISGSAPLLTATFEDFHKRTGHRILERYGMSETGMLTSNPLDGERLAGTVGYALPSVETRVCDGEGHPVAPGEVGTLEVRGPNVFGGYWNMPDKTADSFHDDWFVTGDLVQQAEDGRFSIVGRGKDLIISGGLNVYPREVEAALDAQPGVVESAVFGVPHPDFGEAVVAVVVPAPDIFIEPNVLASTLKMSLSAYKIPKNISIVKDLPRNTMGKVQKSLLRLQYADLFIQGSSGA